MPMHQYMKCDRQLRQTEKKQINFVTRLTFNIPKYKAILLRKFVS